MSRLIDADKFEKFIQQKYKDGEKTEDIKYQMLFDLSYQQTVYDPDKVVEQLESKKWDIHDWRDKWRNEIIDECIEIVKDGGVN